MKKKTVAVIGHTGMVGGSAMRWFKDQGHEVMGISRSKQTHTWKQVNKEADWIIIAVPTPFDWESDKVNLSALKEVLGKIASGKKVIHKCTVPPGTTEVLQTMFPELKLIYNPEFLSEATCDRDFSNPDRQLIGYTENSYPVSMEALNLLPESACGLLMRSFEAEIDKFINNFHGALMVIFANMFYDISEQLGGDFERIKTGAQASKWVGSPMGRMYWDVFHKGFRGYGGKCFPKDINMLIKFCESLNIPHEILKATREANIRILKEQKLTEEKAEKK